MHNLDAGRQGGSPQSHRLSIFPSVNNTVNRVSPQGPTMEMGIAGMRTSLSYSDNHSRKKGQSFSLFRFLIRENLFSKSSRDISPWYLCPELGPRHNPVQIPEGNSLPAFRKHVSFLCILVH